MNSKLTKLCSFCEQVQYARGKTYNIRIDDQILVRFSPRTPQSIYHFGDVVSVTIIMQFSSLTGLRWNDQSLRMCGPDWVVVAKDVETC